MKYRIKDFPEIRQRVDAMDIDSLLRSVICPNYVPVKMLLRVMRLPHLYTLTFMVEGTPTEVSVKEGETPRYPGLPIKAADDTNKYTFEKWDKEIVAATETTTYTAVFKAVPKNGSTTDSDPTDDTTAAPETTAPTQTTEPAEKKSGCKGSVAIAGVAVVMAIGTAVLVKKKED